MIFDKTIITKAQIMETTLYVIEYMSAVGLIETTPEVALILSILPIFIQSYGEFPRSWMKIGINPPL